MSGSVSVGIVELMSVITLFIKLPAVDLQNVCDV